MCGRCWNHVAGRDSMERQLINRKLVFKCRRFQSGSLCSQNMSFGAFQSCTSHSDLFLSDDRKGQLAIGSVYLCTLQSTHAMDKELPTKALCNESADKLWNISVWHSADEAVWRSDIRPAASSTKLAEGIRFDKRASNSSGKTIIQLSVRRKLLSWFRVQR